MLVDLIKNFREIEMLSNHMEATFKFEKNFETIFSSRQDWSIDGTTVDEDVTVFTDGSKMNEGTGAGIYCKDLKFGVSIHLGTLATMFQSEAYAISENCDLLIKRQIVKKKILICSDSESAIKAISSCKLSAKSVLRGREILDTLSENNEVSLVWVPGHSDIPGNEKADELARAGGNTSFIGPDGLCVGCYYHFI